MPTADADEGQGLQSRRPITPFTMSPPISLARPARSTCSRLHSTISSGTTHAPRHVPIIRSVPQLRRWRKEARSRGLEVGLVPTVSNSAVMGSAPKRAAAIAGTLAKIWAERTGASPPHRCRSSPTKTNFLATDRRAPVLRHNAGAGGGVGDRTSHTPLPTSGMPCLSASGVQCKCDMRGPLCSLAQPARFGSGQPPQPPSRAPMSSPRRAAAVRTSTAGLILVHS